MKVMTRTYFGEWLRSVAPNISCKFAAGPK